MSVIYRRGPWATKAPLARRNLATEVDDYFTSIGRDSHEEVQLALRVMLGVPLVQDVINAIPLPVSVLNDKGQVILTNRQWDRELDADPNFSYGKRHGELFHCIHQSDGPDGCATSSSCAACGAGECIFESLQSQQQVTREFHLHRETSTGTDVVDRVVTASPIKVDDRDFTVFVVSDCRS